jgi:glycosyl-4,4'-diaponeurosporenoate acyltransferase
MAPFSGWGAVAATAILWLVWSLVIGALANQLPDRLLGGRDPCQADHPGAAPLRFYERWLGIRIWKPWIPDAGNALPGGIRKGSLARRDPRALQRLSLETRRAELVHWVLWPAWMVTALWLPPSGVLINLIFATLFNLPCLLLQRYNRLRLGRTLSRTLRSHHPNKRPSMGA